LWIPLSTRLDFPPKRDEKDYHLPVVQTFVERNPTLVDWRDPRVEMGPFFHVVLGSIGRVIGGDPDRLRLVMACAGIASIALFALAARRVPGTDPDAAVLLLAAFPYFGAAHFTVMTDYGAFLPLVAAWVAQLDWLATRRERSLWAASIASLLAGLVRQTMVFAPLAFAAVVLLGGASASGVRSGAGSRTPPWRIALALAIPFLAVVVRFVLWGGLLPPAYVPEGGLLGIDASDPWKGASPRNWFLALVSIAANVGYYLAPATFAAAWAERTKRRTLAMVGAGALLATTLLAIVRGPQLITTYGTFLHVVTTARLRVGEAAGFAIVTLSIASFLLFAAAAWRSIAAGGPSKLPRRLLGVTLVAALLILSFGKFRIFERYILPIHALAVLLFAGTITPSSSRLARAGIILAVLFGLAHEIVYALNVYDIR